MNKREERVIKLFIKQTMIAWGPGAENLRLIENTKTGLARKNESSSVGESQK